MQGFSLRVSTILAVVALSAVAIFAQGTPSSKATAAFNTSVACTVKGTTNIGDTIPVDCHVFQTAGAPPKSGSRVLPISG